MSNEKPVPPRVMQPPPQPPKKITDPRVRVMTFGKIWADLLRQDPAAAQYILMSVGSPGYCISPEDFEAIREQEPKEFYQNLPGNSSAASSWVIKLQYYVRKA